MKMFKLFVCCAILATFNTSCIHAKTETGTAEATQSPLRSGTSSPSEERLDFSSGVRSILHDRRGNYWFGSHKEGVARFDGQRFTYFTVEQGLSDNQVRTIQEDDSGRVWFGTARGVDRIDGEQIISHREAAPSAFAFLDTDHERRATQSELWFSAGTRAGFYAFDGSKLRFVGFPANRHQLSNAELLTVTDLSKGDGENGWIATFSAVFGYNDGSITVLDHEYFGFAVDSEKLHVRSVLEDSKGRLWIGNNGIGVLLIEGEEITDFSRTHGLIHPGSKGRGDPSPAGTLEHVFAISEDKSGAIWFGDRDTGAWRFADKSVSNFTVDPALQSQHIWHIYQDPNGELLFGMGAGGVYVFNGTSFDRKF